MILKKAIALLCSITLALLSVQAQDSFQDELNRAHCKQIPADFTCKAALRKLNWLRKRITTCCDELDQLFILVEQETSKFNSCDTPFLIDQAFIDDPAQNPITASGHYCLQEDVTGTLIVNADNVWIDLNNHILDGVFTGGIDITANHRNIAIRNGIISGTNGSVGAIRSSGTSNLAVENVTFGQTASANLVGLRLFAGVNNFLVRNCNFANNNNAIIITLSSNGKISDCLVKNGIDGFSGDFAMQLAGNTSSVLVKNTSFVQNANTTVVNVTGSNSCIFDQCNFNTNTGTTALRFDTSSSCVCVDCMSNQNPNATGFLVTNVSSEIVFDRCYSSNNDTGFWFNGVSQNCIFNSFAKQNSVDGFLVNDGASNYLHANTAINNTGAGFAGSGSNVWTSNVASANGTNYTVGIPGPFAVFDLSDAMFTSTETAWDNIDVQP